jgi:hypothetical protein
MSVTRRVILVLALCGLASLTLACRPGPGYVPKTVAEMVPGSPVVAVVQLTKVTGDINIQDATATVQCVFKHGNMNRAQAKRLLGRTISIKGYGNGSLCKNMAYLGSSDLVYMTQDKAGAYSLRYDGPGSAARAATMPDIAAVRAALTPRQRAAAVCRPGYKPVASGN